MGLLLEPGIADLIGMGKGEVQIIRPAGVPGENYGMQIPGTQLFLQRRQGAHRQLVVLGQHIDEALAPVRAKPEGVAGKKVAVVYEVDQMPSGVARDQEALHPDALDVQHLPIFQKYPLIVRFHHGQLVKPKDHLVPHFSGEVAVFYLTYVELGILEQALSVSTAPTWSVSWWVMRMCLILDGSMSSQPIFSFS